MLTHTHTHTHTLFQASQLHYLYTRQALEVIAHARYQPQNHKVSSSTSSTVFLVQVYVTGRIKKLWCSESQFYKCKCTLCFSYTGWPPKNGTVNFSGLCSDQQLSFFALLDRAYFLIIITPRSSNLVENFLWVISYGLSLSGFARFPEFLVRLMTVFAVHKLTEYCVQWSVYCP